MILIAGCSSSDSDKPNDSGTNSTSDVATNNTNTTNTTNTNNGGVDAFGAFVVSLVEPSDNTPGQTKVVGKINDGPTPEGTIWEEAAKQGDCQLLTPRAPFCDPICGGGAVCVEDDTCLAHPKALAAGTVTVDGLETEDGETTFTMEPIANNYQPAMQLKYPACAEGEPVTLSAAGDAVPAFSLTVDGIAPLELLNDEIDLADGTAVTLKWTAAAKGSSHVQVLLDISHHGGSKGKILCDTADSGSLELTAEMLDQLKALGVSGFPTVVVTRRSETSTKAGEGSIDLVIDSRIEREVKIPGVVSCMEDADCVNAGLTRCQDDRRCI